VRREAAAGRELVHPGVAVAAVEAEVLRPPARRPRPWDRNRLESRG
jgi:hypothetical protein